MDTKHLWETSLWEDQETSQRLQVTWLSDQSVDMELSKAFSFQLLPWSWHMCPPWAPTDGTNSSMRSRSTGSITTGGRGAMTQSHFHPRSSTFCGFRGRQKNRSWEMRARAARSEENRYQFHFKWGVSMASTGKCFRSMGHGLICLPPV